MSPRKFEFKPGIREQVPLLVGIMGPSGGGKTLSALRLAAGMQRVSGGSIDVIDTEAGRALHYADRVDFRHCNLTAPFSPLDYEAVIKQSAADGAGTIIIDSTSHEHEGPGGVLEWHDKEVERMGGERHNFRAWGKPKAARRQLINTILQLRCNMIFCFRAKEKAKTVTETDQKIFGIATSTKKELTDLGWMPIAGEEFVYEMMTSILLPPNAGGVPEWNPERPGERAMVKPADQFRELFRESRPLDEDHGEAMARWAAGAPPGPYRFTQGDHKGVPITDVPSDYLVKIMDHPDASAKMKGLADAEIGRRMKAEAAK